MRDQLAAEPQHSSAGVKNGLPAVLGTLLVPLEDLRQALGQQQVEADLQGRHVVPVVCVGHVLPVQGINKRLEGVVAHIVDSLGSAGPTLTAAQARWLTVRAQMPGGQLRAF